MSSIRSFRDLLVEELRELYDAEQQLTQAMPKLVKASTNEELRHGLTSHLTETQDQVGRLEQAFELLDEPAKGQSCAGMDGIIEEGDWHAEEEYGSDSIRDAAIIGAAQRVEHY